VVAGLVVVDTETKLETEEPLVERTAEEIALSLETVVSLALKEVEAAPGAVVDVADVLAGPACVVDWEEEKEMVEE
jgi:hypothetical protein